MNREQRQQYTTPTQTRRTPPFPYFANCKEAHTKHTPTLTYLPGRQFVGLTKHIKDCGCNFEPMYHLQAQVHPWPCEWRWTGTRTDKGGGGGG
jgi:hypothetical protein